MSFLVFQNPDSLPWLLLVPVFIGLFRHAAIKRRAALQAFGLPPEANRLSRKREAFGSCAAATLLALSLARPAFSQKEVKQQHTGRDIVFLLDVSNSMLAEDRHPNRLQNVKTAILDSLPTLAGNRLGLVLFAGSAEIRCPLTVDHEYFRMALRQADPQSVSVGGTLLAPALEKVFHKLLPQEDATMLDLVLISDGEDQLDGPDEVEAAQQLEQAGARLLILGVGAKAEGSPVRRMNMESGSLEPLTKNGRAVTTRLDAGTLQRMVENTSTARYFDIGIEPLDLPRLLSEVMADVPQQTLEHAGLQYEDAFPYFLGAAAFLLLVTYRWRAS